MNPRDGIIRFYFNHEEQQKPPISGAFDSLSSVSKGLGDIIVATSFFKAAFFQGKKFHFLTQNPHFSSIIRFNPYYTSGTGSRNFKTEDLENFNVGNGHLSQKFQRVLGLNPDLKPQGTLVIHKEKIKTKIGFHFDVGGSAQYLRHLHAFPRQIYSHNLALFQEFIQENPQFEFVQFGMNNFGFNGVTDFCKRSIDDSITELATCEYFIGVNSGFMNLAAALNIKSIIIVNLPTINSLYLPCMKSLPIPDLNWLYPQNVHLHQDGANEFVSLFSKLNLQKAINGEIYPFWQDDHLNLIYENNT